MSLIREMPTHEQNPRQPSAVSDRTIAGDEPRQRFDIESDGPDSTGQAQENLVSETPKPAGHVYSKQHEIAFIFVVCTAQILSLAGLGQSIAPLHIITKDLGATSLGEQS